MDRRRQRLTLQRHLQPAAAYLNWPTSRTKEPDDGDLGYAYGNQPGDHPPGLRRLAAGDRCHHRVFAPGMVWRIEGHSAASKEYGSKQQFIDEVLAPFGARFAGSEPFRPVTIRGVYSDGDTVTVIWDGRGIANDGQPYENSYAWIMKLADGQVVDGTAFYDSISFNDLWARVQPS